MSTEVVESTDNAPHVPELAAVRARGVKADEGPALAGLLEVHAMRPPLEHELEVSPDDRLEHEGQPAGRTRRGAASTSFT
jgi:hypothetical protein